MLRERRSGFSAAAPKSNSLGGVRLPPSRSIRDGAAEPNLSQHLRDEVRRLVNLARELAEQMGADPEIGRAHV